MKKRLIGVALYLMVSAVIVLSVDFLVDGVVTRESFRSVIVVYAVGVTCEIINGSGIFK